MAQHSPSYDDELLIVPHPDSEAMTRATDAERMIVFRVLLDALEEPVLDNSETDPVLHRICAGLVRTSRMIRLACYVIVDEQADVLVPEFSAGLSTATLRIRGDEAGVFRQVLDNGMPQVQVLADPTTPSWLQPLHTDIAEIVLFPFGGANLRGVGMIGASEAGYFRRVGLGYFAAFTNLGELTLDLRTMALRDPLTELPNRALFLDRLAHACQSTQRLERLLGVALLDIDGFKHINDRYGRQTGDAVLQQLAKNIQGVMRPTDTLARIGGDEFAILFVDVLCLDDLEVLCDRVIAVLRDAPILVNDGHAVSLSGSLGVTVYPLDDGDPEALMRHADLALHAAQVIGRDQYRIHSLELDHAVHQDFLTRGMVKRALAEDKLLMHYQPIVAIGGGIVGVEALLRLAHEHDGLLTPSAFAAALDYGSLARMIGCFVLEAVATQAEDWSTDGLMAMDGNPLRFSINISAQHLLSPLFLGDLQATLRRHPRLAPATLEIEITESAPLRDLPGVQGILRACTEMGIRTALDDFGTGAASLTYLQKLPVHTLKIDQSFVCDMVHDPKDFAIVSGVIHVANLLGLNVVAEGAETLEHIVLLAQLGCQYVQGYAIAKPMAAADIPAWMRQYHETSSATRP
ncbi:MAG TPA: EAL domain-containing protein [Acidiferrobacter sp.]|nr:EAL domain-containing protein [Acidiferrobacter sp.]